MEKVTTTIRRQFLCEIIAGRKNFERRVISPYWQKKLEGKKCPFLLRLINGRKINAPEVTVQIDEIKKNYFAGYYELVIGSVVSYQNWDIKNECPII